MRIIVIILFGAGYGLFFYWLYAKYLSKYPGINRVFYSLSLALLIIVAFAFNVASLPKKPKPEPLAEKLMSKWANRILKGQDQTGGIYINILDPAQGTQVWTTAQALKAVLSAQINLEEHTEFVRAGFNYIESVRRVDPEEGWGLQVEHRRTITEIASWVANDSELPTIVNRIQRDLDHIASRQESNGGWRPIREEAPHNYPSFTRTYSTIMALWSLVEARRLPIVHRAIGNKYDQNITKAIARLFATYDKDLGWFPNPNRGPQRERFEGLSAQVLFVLSRAENDFGFLEQYNIYIEAEKNFIKYAELCKRSQCKNNRLHDSDVSFRPTDYVAEGSTMLWFPWSFAELTHLATDASLSENERRAAARLREDILKANLDELDKHIESEYTYVLAENLFSLANSIYQAPASD